MTSVSHVDDGPDKNAVANDPDPPAAKPNLKGDWPNFSLLMLLYTLQGMPLGLVSAIPILLQSNKNVTYQDQVILIIIKRSECRSMSLESDRRCD